MNNKAGLYIRVSTDAQFEEGYSVDAQKEMLEAYCKTKRIKQYDFYIDGGYTGSNIDRPELNRLIQDVKENKISNVIVYKLDRLSRSQKDTLYLIEDVFNPHNTDFVSLNENFDTSTPIGRAMLGIMSAFAQLERETIRERTRMGMKERVKTGLWMGGGRIPFGYDYDKNKGVLVPNEDADKVKKTYELYLKGYSTDRIANILGLKYERLAHQILKRKSNAGYICYNGEEYLGKHEPIISLEIYEKAMQMMKERSVKKIVNTDHLLTGLVYCGKCGAKMRYQKWGKTGCKLVCYSQQKSKKYLIKDPNCDNIRFWADEVEDAVIKDLFRVSLSYNNENSMENKKQPEVTALELLHEQYDCIANKIKRLYNLYAESANDLLLETIKENQKELKNIQSQIEIEQKRNTLTNKFAEKKEKLKDIEQVWNLYTIKEKQEVLRLFIDKIIINEEHVDIHYNMM